MVRYHPQSLKQNKSPENISTIMLSRLLTSQGMRESNSHQRFWRPLSYHLTNPLCTNIDYHFHGNLSILLCFSGLHLQNFTQRFPSLHILHFSDALKLLLPIMSLSVCKFMFASLTFTNGTDMTTTKFELHFACSH